MTADYKLQILLVGTLDMLATHVVMVFIFVIILATSRPTWPTSIVFIFRQVNLLGISRNRGSTWPTTQYSLQLLKRKWFDFNLTGICYVK